MAFLYKLFRNKLVPPADLSTSFTNKTILITGASIGGLGYAAAEKFALKGAARIILAVRDSAKGRKAKTAIEQTLRARGKQCSVEVWTLDMGDYASIRAFAERADVELESLDVVVLNAGVHNTSYQTGRYGWEADLQVNALSTTLLALLLLPKLRQTKKLSNTGETPTLEVVSSGLHYVTKLSEEQKSSDDVALLEEFNKPEGFVANRQYGRSKLMLMYAVDALTELTTTRDGEPEVFVTAVW